MAPGQLCKQLKVMDKLLGQAMRVRDMEFPKIMEVEP